MSAMDMPRVMLVSGPTAAPLVCATPGYTRQTEKLPAFTVHDCTTRLWRKLAAASKAYTIQRRLPSRTPLQDYMTTQTCTHN